MDEIKNRLYEAMSIRGMKAIELSERTGIPKSSISQYLSGYAEPKSDRLYQIAKALHIREEWLLGYDVSMEREYDGIGQIKKIMLPVLGSVSCGLPKYAEEERGLYVSADLDVDADFVLIASGDSMINAGIKDGCYVLCKRCDMVENGQIACVIINDDALLKRIYYYPENGLLLLHAENPAYRDITLTGEDLNSVTIIGRAVMYQGMVE